MNHLGTSKRYGTPAIVMHWLMALILVVLVVCIEMHELFPKGSEIRKLLVSSHFMLGVLIPILLVVRLIVLTRPTPPIVPPPPRWQQVLAKAVQGLLYLLMLAMPVLGYLTVNAKGRAVPFFGGQTLPVLIDKNPELAEQLMDLHELGADIAFVLVGLHVAAALFHHFVVRDNTLLRMRPGRD